MLHRRAFTAFASFGSHSCIAQKPLLPRHVYYCSGHFCSLQAAVNLCKVTSFVRPAHRNDLSQYSVTRTRSSKHLSGYPGDIQRQMSGCLRQPRRNDGINDDVEAPLISGNNDAYGACGARSDSTELFDGEGSGGNRGSRGHGRGYNSDDGDSFEDDRNAFGNWFSLPVMALKRYIRFLDEAPLTTKIVTAGLLGAISDIIAQFIENSAASKFEELDTDSVSLNWQRVFALAAVGMVLTAPMFHYLYDFLEHSIPTSTAGWRALRNISAQLAVDQLLAAPLWVLAFYASFSFFEKGQFVVDDVMGQIRRDFVPTMRLTWAIFPIFQVISFGFLPKKLRVLVLNVVDLGYTAALSYIKHR